MEMDLDYKYIAILVSPNLRHKVNLAVSDTQEDAEEYRDLFFKVHSQQNDIIIEKIAVYTKDN